MGTVEPRYKTNIGFRVLGRLICAPRQCRRLGRGRTRPSPRSIPRRLSSQFAQREPSFHESKARLANASATEERKRTLIASDATTKQTLGRCRAGASRRRSISRSRAGQPDQGTRATGLCAAQGRFRRRRHRGWRRCRDKSSRPGKLSLQ